MARAPGLFDVDARLRELSAKGDDLERVNALVDFEAFRPELEQAVPRADRAKGGRPPYDHVLMFRILILQASHSLSDERTEYLVKDRLSFMRFLGLSLADRVPDANSIWNFREADASKNLCVSAGIMIHSARGRDGDGSWGGRLGFSTSRSGFGISRRRATTSSG